MFSIRQFWGWKMLCDNIQAHTRDIVHVARLHTAVKPSDPKVQALLSNLAGLDLTKLMARRQEPLIVPHYKLMTLEELQEAQKKTVELAKSMLHTPPILPERLPCGEVIEVDENLAEAISHRMIFTETSQHKENKLRSIVVREVDGVLRKATWEERDRMYQIFLPVLGRKMWLPKVLTKEILPSALDKMHHKSVLDLVCVQCDPQSHDYHRVKDSVHRCVYEDIEKRGCYDLLRSTPYFGCLVWYLLTDSHPPQIYGLLKDILHHRSLSEAAELIQLHMLCFPNDDISQQLETDDSEESLVKGFCKLSSFYDLLGLLEKNTLSLS